VHIKLIRIIFKLTKTKIMKKVVLEIDDFNKIVTYITSQLVPFQNASKAVEITEIIKKAKIAELELKEDEKVDSK
jgi:hypothetical protein